MSGSLTGEATWLAVCASITRADGVRLAFTTHDRALEIEGTRYAACGLEPSAIVHEVGARGGSFEVGVPAEGVRGLDVGAGRFDGAAVQVFLADWRLGVAVEPLAAGRVAGVAREGEGMLRFTVSDLLESWAEVGPAVCSPTCRATLGDALCGVDMAGRRLRVLAAPVVGGVRVFAEGGLERFVPGRMRVLTGASAGLERRTTGLVGDTLLLDEPVAEGDAFEAELSEGCDRRFATCADRFGNAAAFRGEPHVPGTDALLRRG